MSVSTAAVLFVVAGFLGLLSALIYRGHTGLISGHTRSDLDGAATEDALGRWFGARMVPLVAATAGLGLLELRGAAPDWAWFGYVLVVFVTAAWLIVGGRRFASDTDRG